MRNILCIVILSLMFSCSNENTPENNNQIFESNLKFTINGQEYSYSTPDNLIVGEGGFFPNSPGYINFYADKGTSISNLPHLEMGFHNLNATDYLNVGTYHSSSSVITLNLSSFNGNEYVGGNGIAGTNIQIQVLNIETISGFSYSRRVYSGKFSGILKKNNQFIEVQNGEFNRVLLVCGTCR